MKETLAELNKCLSFVHLMVREIDDQKLRLKKKISKQRMALLMDDLIETLGGVR